MAFMIHDSDNTATDAILNRLGGTCAVMKFLFASDIEGISVKRTMHELLTYYYDLQPSHGIGGMVANRRRMTPAVCCRPGRGGHLIDFRGENCSPPATV